MRNTRLAIRVAMRYLWSRKSHSAVTAIAIAGVCGVAIATMAIVCVLSVFNGFHEAIVGRDARITPDILVSPAKGAVITNADSLADLIRKHPGTQAVTPVVKDEAVAYYGGHQLPVNILGVDPDQYRKITAIDSITISGTWKPQPQQIVDIQTKSAETPQEMADIESLAEEEFDEAALFEEENLTLTPDISDSIPVSPILASTGVVANLGLPPLQEVGMLIFIPRRTGTGNFTDPASAFMVDSLAVTGVFESDQSEFDAATVLMEINVARRLLEYDKQANGIYIALQKGSNPDKYKESLQAAVGNDYRVSVRADQQGIHFRMVAIEKWITFLMLGFILIIASFNIISSLSMLIVEKRRNILTMTGYGATRSFIGSIFFWESAMVCLAGSVIGMILGTVLCLLQMQFGFITIPGGSKDMLLSAYPVEIRMGDLGIIALLSIAVALLTSAISAAYARRTASSR